MLGPYKVQEAQHAVPSDQSPLCRKSNLQIVVFHLGPCWLQGR